jgi:uncharacterized protein YdcH (DUF465 family)
MSVRKPAQVRAPLMAPMAPVAMEMATAAPVSGMSRLSLVLGAGAKEAAVRQAEATGVRPGKEAMGRARRVIVPRPSGGFKKPSIKDLGRGRSRLFGADDDNASNASGDTWDGMLEEAEAQDRAAKEAEVTDEEGDDAELNELAAQKAPEALGPAEMVKARLFTLAAKFYIHALEQFMEMAGRSGEANLMMFTKGRIEKKTAEYAEMMASNGFDLEAKLKSTDESDAYFQKIFATMRDALERSIRMSETRLIGDQMAFSKLEKASQLAAAFTMKFAGTELEQPGPKDAAEAKSVEETADRLVVMIMDLFKQ